MLKSWYRLNGRIDITKEIKLSDGTIEKHYADEYGDTATLIMPDLKDKKITLTLNGGI